MRGSLRIFENAPEPKRRSTADPCAWARYVTRIHAGDQDRSRYVRTETRDKSDTQYEKGETRMRQATVAFRIPQEYKDRLEELSAKMQQSKSALLKEALRELLEEMEDASVALERLGDGKREPLSGEELRKRLGL